MDKELADIYFNLKDSGGFSGVSALYRSAKEKGLAVSLNTVREYLKGVDTYTTHKPARIRSIRNRTITFGIKYQFQSDLISVQNISKYNRGYNYLVGVIDIFSKMAYVEAVKDKRGVTVAGALRKIFSRSGNCVVFQSDLGSEFISRAVQSELKSRGIKFFATNSSVKSAIIERWNRTIQARLYRYFTYKNTLKYIDVIQDLVMAYNNSYHRSIKCKPIEVTRGKTKQVWMNLYGDLSPAGPAKYDFEVGDIVRISKSKGIFEPGYLANWSEELFRIQKRMIRRPQIVYIIGDMHDETIQGIFYNWQLQLVYKDLTTCSFKIEKILKRRRKSGKTVELLVRWLGYGPQFDSWIKEIDLQ